MPRLPLNSYQDRRITLDDLDERYRGGILVPGGGVDFVANCTAAAASLAATGGVLIIPPGDYTISSTINLAIPPNSTVIAQGAYFTCTHDGVAFDLNPEATATLPRTDTADTYTKRNITWRGGTFVNNNASKTASVAIQAFFCRMLRVEGVKIGHLGDYLTDGFYAGFKFGAKDTYRFIDCYVYAAKRAYWVPASGVLYTESLAGNDLLDVELRGCHTTSVAGFTEAAFYSENRILHYSMNGGSCNGAPSVAAVRLASNATLYSEGVSIQGVHFENMPAGVPAVLFDASAGQGFYGVDIGSGTQFLSPTIGWQGVVLDACHGVNFGIVNFRDGSGGATEVGVFVDSDSRRVNISDQCNFLGFATGQQVVLGAPADRSNVTVGKPIALLSTPTLLGGYNGTVGYSTATTTLDLSSLLTSFSGYLLPPRGYLVTLTAYDTGSAAATGDTCNVRLYKPGAGNESGLGVHLAGIVNNGRGKDGGFVAADSAGDLTLAVNATGANTMFIWISVAAVYQ